MAYSEIDLFSRDIDFFFKDREKYIHIASCGGQMPIELVENDIENDINFLRLNELELNFDIEVNPNLNMILDDPNLSIRDYLSDFVLKARRGFYTYDKTKIGDFYDRKFHLVAKPILKGNNILKVNTIIESKNILPENWEPFDLFEFF